MKKLGNTGAELKKGVGHKKSVYHLIAYVLPCMHAWTSSADEFFLQRNASTTTSSWTVRHVIPLIAFHYIYVYIYIYIYILYIQLPSNTYVYIYIYRFMYIRPWNEMKLFPWLIKCSILFTIEQFDRIMVKNTTKFQVVRVS